MAVLISDSFNRVDSTTTLGTTDSYNGGTAETWSYLHGVYGIYSNGAYAVSVSGGDSRAWVDSGASDVGVTTKVNVFNDSYAHLVRYNPANNSGIAIGASGKVETFTGGTYTTIASGITFANGDVVKTVLNGSTITIYVNDVQVKQLTSTFNQTATCHGLTGWRSSGTAPGFSNGDYWDYFFIEDLATSGTTYSGAGTSAGTSSLTSSEKVIQSASGSVQGNSSLTSNEIKIYSASGLAQGNSSLTPSETQIVSASGTAQGSSSLSSSETVISHTGTTYSSSGTAQGSSSLTSSDKVVFGANGTSQGATILSPGEHLILPSVGTSTGQSSLTSNETVVGHGTTTYSGSGQAQGSSSLSSAETMIYAANGTAQGLSSLIAHEIIRLLASGISEGYSTLTFIDKSNQIIGTIHLKGSQVLNVTLQGSQVLNVNLKGGI